MGMGDEVMVTGEARRLQEKDSRTVLVVDKRGRPRWHPVWQGNARIARAPGRHQQVLLNGSGQRPYVDYRHTTDQRWAYTDWRAAPGEIFLTGAERAIAVPAGAILVEPHIKAKASPNKQWGWERWQTLVELLRPMGPVVQVGRAGTPVLAGSTFIETADFRLACAVVEKCAAAVLPEGGLHHAAAALGRPAVVIFGGHCLPANTGYDAHVNLFNGTAETIGWRIPHDGAQRCMAAIAPADVAAEVHRIIERT